MINKNKGFSLIELMISFAILGVVSAIIVGMITASSNTYKSVTAEVDLQYESQLAMSQLQEYIVDCNGGICFKDNNLYLLNTDGTNFTAHVFRFDSTDSRLYYVKAPVTVDATSGAISCPIATGDFMASNVAAFGVNLTTTDLVTSAVVTLTFQNGGKEYTATQITSLRNNVTLGTSFDSMLVSVCGS